MALYLLTGDYGNWIGWETLWLQDKDRFHVDISMFLTFEMKILCGV